MTIININRLYVKTAAEGRTTIDEYFTPFRTKVLEYIAKGFKPAKVSKNPDGTLKEVWLVRA